MLNTTLKTTSQRFAAVTFLFATFLVPSSHAMIVISGDVNAGTGVLTISNDITFNITSDGIAQIFNLDEWGAPSDGTQDFLGAFSGTITFEHNGNSTSRPLDLILDNLTSTLNQLTPNDAYFGWFPSIPVTSGDVLTVQSGSWAIPAATDWNPAATGSFAGDVFLTDNWGNQISSAVTISAIPEASAVSCLTLVAIGTAVTRRRKKSGSTGE